MNYNMMMGKRVGRNKANTSLRNARLGRESLTIDHPLQYAKHGAQPTGS
jgi:hypothetical protein